MQETANYKLKKLELTDFADITQLNSNADIIDREIKKLSDEKAPLESPVLTGVPAVPTPANESNIKQVVNIEYVKEALKTVDLSSKLDHTAVVQNADLNTLLEDKAYICVGTLKNVPVANTYCIVRCYDGATTNRVVQICYIPQSDNTVRTFVRAVTSTTTFGKWVELGSVTKVNNIIPDATGNVKLPVATSETYGIVRAAAVDDVLDETVTEAAITPAVYHDVSDFRHHNTAYVLGDKVRCMFNFELFLECTKAGTTGADPLDTRNVKHGQVLTDGTVQWTVRTHIKSVAGVVAGANGDVPIDLTAKPQKLSLNTDLNTLTESGLFYADNEHGENLVLTLKNRPSQELIRGGGTALIEVVKSNNKTVRQVYTEHLMIPPNICVRTLAGNAWSEWIRLNTIIKVW